MQPQNPYQQPQVPQQPQTVNPGGAPPAGYQPVQTAYQAPAGVGGPANGGHGGKILLISTIVLAVGLVAALGFGGWAFSKYQTQKTEVDTIAAERVEAALVARETELQAQFQQERDRVENTFTGPDVYGSVTFKYPRDWSIFISDAGLNSAEYTTVVHPKAVRAESAADAITFDVIDKPFAEAADDYQREVADGTLTSRSQQVNGQQGVRLNGQIASDMTGSVVLLPLRDKTIRLTTESNDFQNVFADVLTSLTYSP